MDEKKSFILYGDNWEYWEMLTVEERGELITAIYKYFNTGELVELSGKVKMLFSFTRSQIDRDTKKWKQEREQRSKAGKAGANARWGKDS